MKTRLHLFLSFYIFISLLPQQSFAQDLFPATAQEVSAEEPSDSAVLQPFPLAGITKEFGATSRLIDDAGELHVSPETFEELTRDLDTLVSQIDGFLEDSTTRFLEDESSRELDQISQQARYYIDAVEQLQSRLSDVANDLESESVLLQDNRKRWQLTMEQDVDDEALESRLDRIQRTMNRVDSVRNILQKDLATILDQQDDLAYKKTALQEVESRIRVQKALLGETIFTRDVPGFFQDLKNIGDLNMYQSHWEGFKSSVKTDLVLLKAGYMRSMISSLLILALLLVFGIWFKKNHGNWLSEKQFPLSELHQTFINSPVISMVFLVTVMVRLLIPDLPRTFYSLNLMVLMIPLTILVIRIYGKKFRVWIILLVVLVYTNLFYELAYHPGVLLRLLLLFISLLGIWLFFRIHRSQAISHLIKHKFVLNLFRGLIVLFLVLESLSIIANLAGTFRLAEFLALIPFQITLLAVAIQLATKYADALLYLVLSSNYLQRLNVVRTEFQIIYRKLTWLTDLILLLVFISIAFKILRIKETVFDWGRGLLNDGRKIGAIDISLGSILIFIFVIWLSIMISRIISHILEQDVFTRIKTGKGIPGTIILMLKIVLISGGFFLAAAASGMQLTNLSIVLGAFSVGIGFGLQNIFNNMVSGLILAFERPINVGDIVQVGELMGRVKSIGLRSSTVHSFDGAEVVVPNGNLISNEMINWTLSDSYRRMDIRVGVAYGTDPERVLKLMLEIALEHEGVLKEPVPRVFFIEFGDSSLNFRLLAWAHLDVRLETESEINVLINKRLKEEGIEIPFPQRDLHIRSDATKPPSGQGSPAEG